MTDHSQYADNLALYALNSLNDPQERAEVEAHLHSCAACREELEALRGDASLLALSSVGPQPPQRARQRLLNAIAREPRRERRRQNVVVGVLRPRWLTFAPIAAALLLAIFGLLLVRSNLRLRDRVEAAQAQLEEKNRQLREATAIVELLHAPDAQQLTLVKTGAPPQPHVKMIYQPKKGGLLLMASNLDPLPANKVYELWLLPANGGAPMPAGTFTPQSDGNAMMHHTMESGVEAKAFAITVEPEGGSSTPTMPIRMMSAG